MSTLGMNHDLKLFSAQHISIMSFEFFCESFVEKNNSGWPLEVLELTKKCSSVTMPITFGVGHISFLVVSLIWTCLEARNVKYLPMLICNKFSFSFLKFHLGISLFVEYNSWLVRS